MLSNLLFGLLTMTICLMLMSVLIILVIHYYSVNEYLVETPLFWKSLLVITGVMLLLVLGNIIQIAIWAMLFQGLGEFEQFSEAFYHSAVNFATLGYGDIIMTDKYKLLGPLQAINGVLMIGVSTAVLMAAFQDAIKKTIRARGINLS